MPLTHEDAEKIRLKNIANIIRKANAGKTLTNAERALIDSEAAGAQPGAPFASTWDALAQRLGISRRGLQKVRERFTGQLPPDRADGRHDVAAWSRFFAEHHINAADEDAALAGSDDGLTIAELKRREIAEKIRKLQIENAIAERSAVPLDEIQARLPPMLMAFNTGLNNLAPRLCQKLEGFDDYSERLQIIETEIEELKKTFAACPWLDEHPAIKIETPSAALEGASSPETNREKNSTSPVSASATRSAPPKTKPAAAHPAAAPAARPSGKKRVKKKKP